jgi:hypothetical protein
VGWIAKYCRKWSRLQRPMSEPERQRGITSLALGLGFFEST